MECVIVLKECIYYCLIRFELMSCLAVLSQSNRDKELLSGRGVLFAEKNCLELRAQTVRIYCLNLLASSSRRIGSVKYTLVYAIFPLHRGIQDGGGEKIREMETAIVLHFQLRLYNC